MKLFTMPPLATLVVTAAVVVGIAEATAQTVATPTPPPPPTPTEQALSARLWSEVGGNVQCNATLIGFAKQIDELQTQIKNLEAKLKPADPAKK